jgi:hypothetical protein
MNLRELMHKPSQARKCLFLPLHPRALKKRLYSRVINDIVRQIAFEESAVTALEIICQAPVHKDANGADIM